MLAVQSWVQRRFYPVVMILLAAGFTLLLAELLLTHHTDGIQLVAVIASITGLVLSLAALFVQGSARLVVAGLMLVLSISGIVGTFEHLEGDEGREAATELHQADMSQTTYQAVSLHAQEEDEAGEANERGEGNEQGELGERDQGEAAPPPLAPLSLSGLSVMAAVVMVGSGKPRG